MQTRIGLAFAAALIAAAALILTARCARRAGRAGGRGQPDSSTLDDQVDLAVTVYNSDIALVRDVRDLQLPRGSFDLRFMDIAATVNPATVHFRSLTEPSRVSVLEQNYEYDLLEPGQAAAQVRRPRRHAGAAALGERRDARGGGQGAAPQLQQRAGLADRRRDRHRHERRSHQVSRAARQSLHASDADLDARQHRRGAPSRRGVVSRRASCRGTPTTC